MKFWLNSVHISDIPVFSLRMKSPYRQAYFCHLKSMSVMANHGQVEVFPVYWSRIEIMTGANTLVILRFFKRVVYLNFRRRKLEWKIENSTRKN